MSQVFERSSVSGGSLTILGSGDAAETRTYADLVGEAAGAAATLRRRGVDPGTRVAALATTSFDFVLTCLSIWRAGGVVVPVTPPTRVTDRAAWSQATAQRLRLAEVGAVVAWPGDARWDTSATVIPGEKLGSSNQPEFAGPGADDLAVIQFTSGTTASPRGIALRHGALLAQFDAHAKRGGLGDTSDDHCLSWLPLYHDLGFISCLWRPIAKGVTATLLSPAQFLSDPQRWLFEISNRRATHSPAPNFAFALAARHIERGLREPVTLESWRHAACGGELVDPAAIERFVARAEPLGFSPGTIAPGYGLAESTCAVTSSPPGLGLEVDRIDRAALAGGRAEPAPRSHRAAPFASVGTPLAGNKVAIDSADDPIEEERVVGEILVAGPSLMEGYVGDEQATKAVLQGGWLRTGDLGYLWDGRLFVTGRLKDVVIVHGQNYSAEDIERIAGTADGARPGGCVAVGMIDGGSEQLALLVETKAITKVERDACVKSVQSAVWRQVGVAPARVKLLAPRTLPKTSSGKLRRGDARALLTKGDG